jgi:hypothetical protein
MNFLIHYLFGIYEDNVFYIAINQCKTILGYQTANCIGYPYGTGFNMFANYQPLLWNSYFFLSRFVDAVAVYNSYILVGLLATWLSAYFLYKHLFTNKLLGIILGAIFTFSPYFWYQARSHMDLVQGWTLVVFVLLLLRTKTLKSYIYIALWSALTAGVCSYFFYIEQLLMLGYTAYVVIVRKKDWRGTLGKTSIYYVVTLVLTALVLSSFLINEYYPKVKETIVCKIYNCRQIVGNHSSQSSVPNRPLVDFTTFSTRPWYFITPPVDNPITGKIGSSIIALLQNKWGSYLAQNYFPSEHSAAFLGWLNLLLGLFGIYVAVKFKKGRGLVLGIMLATMCLMLPPVIQLKGLTLYLPSFILYKVFSMYRVLSRLGVVVLMMWLVFVGHSLTYITSKVRQPFQSLVLAGYTVVALAEFYIPINLVAISKAPQVYQYLGSIAAKSDAYAVYPQNKATQALFWISRANMPFVNPRDLKRPSINFTSADFTTKLPTCEGLNTAKALGVTYIIYFPKAPDKNSTAAEFFDNTAYLTRVAVFNETTPTHVGNKFWNVTSINESDSAILYKVSSNMPKSCGKV